MNAIVSNRLLKFLIKPWKCRFFAAPCTVGATLVELLKFFLPSSDLRWVSELGEEKERERKKERKRLVVVVARETLRKKNQETEKKSWEKRKRVLPLFLVKKEHRFFGRPEFQIHPNNRRQPGRLTA